MLETIISKLISTLETDRDDTLSFETDNLELDVGLVRYIQFEIIEDFEEDRTIDTPSPYSLANMQEQKLRNIIRKTIRK